MITSRILLRSTKRQLVTLLLLLLRLVFLFLHLALLLVTTTHTVQKCFLLTCFKLNVTTSVLTLTNELTVLVRSEEHTSELQSRFDLVCRLLLEKKKNEYTI